MPYKINIIKSTKAIVLIGILTMARFISCLILVWACKIVGELV